MLNYRLVDTKQCGLDSGPNKQPSNLHHTLCLITQHFTNLLGGNFHNCLIINTFKSDKSVIYFTNVRTKILDVLCTVCNALFATNYLEDNFLVTLDNPQKSGFITENQV